MLAAIDAAQHSITLCTYIFDGDHAGKLFIESLKNAVARGVEVRLLVDDVGSRYSWPTAIYKAERAGIPAARFLPDASLIAALNVAVLRGVDVQIVIPEKTNLKLVQWASTAQLWQLLEHGCRVWQSPAPFDHSKLMIVDGQWSLIGSMNWDPSSLRLNFEFNVECYDSKLAKALTQIAETTIASSKECKLADVDGRGRLVRLRDGFARVLTPYL